MWNEFKKFAFKGNVIDLAVGVVIGAAFGISKIGSNAMDAIARQPQAAGDIRSGMILSAALIEGVALIAVIVCMLSYFVQQG